MFLTREEESILDGEQGHGRRRAMELLVAIGKIYGAEKLVPITSAHLSGVSYKTIGEGGIDFLKEMSQDCRVSVKTTLNPSGMDSVRWREMHVAEEFAQKQLEIVEYYGKLGVKTTCSCTPYLATNVPQKGDTVAWAESSALSYANSVIGARTNREGGPGALAASIIGKTPLYGLHLDANRRATVIIEAEMKEDMLDYALLGQAIGSKIGGAIPFIRGVRPGTDQLKMMAAAMAAAGSVALFHVDEVTPDSKLQELNGLEVIKVDERELLTFKDKITSGKDPDLIALGCPHLSENEVRHLASTVKGKRKIKDTDVWFCTSREVVGRCPREVRELERIGKVVCDTCMIVTPIEGVYRCTATNSCKACNYLPSLCSQKVVCESAETLLGSVMQ
ncbi:MAG: aconitase X catalytic domain-containing protein [Methanomassiliicoccales archaeon]|jgi:predicted aconitase